ncbi:class I SAM-dependent methyltransferase [Rhodococcus sp. D2-41]|uniref:class I SAM-dependent methyltransferase n=1 Tax=Speluncibacter jeojiensis TaxID=2710754 RepID=UPI00240F7F9D|nr:class I SAM-dependent methyltransferase [Rhodococcus sp. D2-41]MDG3012422.1 class I SAM-dependent methyltransferase [Rhodococcus sp. D2-41]
MHERTRWQDERDEAGSREYLRRFDDLAARGADLDGEARMVDALLARDSTVLDAGCGSGRVGAELARRGHRVCAVDLDPTLIEAARARGGLTVYEADLVEFTAPEAPFDAIVMAGNVMVYLAPGTEAQVVDRLASQLRDQGVLVAGSATDRPYIVEEFDRDLAVAGLVAESRFATWDLRPWYADAPWAVTVARKAHPKSVR